MLSTTSTVKQRVCILGATGSIGASTLDVIARHKNRYEIFALTANKKIAELQALCLTWHPRFVVVNDAVQARGLRDSLLSLGLSTQVLEGAESLNAVASHPDVDLVMAAIVGAAGLPPCLAAAHAGKKLLLANKEALVVGGPLLMQAVKNGGGALIPIDSEHSAIFQCLPENRHHWSQRIDHVILTASGGPFRTRPPEQMKTVTPEQACAHPNWVMGQKISVDSATMMNKALEVIEAKWLFDLAPHQIKVLIHPQSIIHSMVVCRDHSVLAQMGAPDMRVPISYGLSFPERMDSGAMLPNFTGLESLSFEAVNSEQFPCLRLAWDALMAPVGSTAILNAANEMAVNAFLAKSIRFDQIYKVNFETMNALIPPKDAGNSLESLLDLDSNARYMAKNIIKKIEM
jgi:1-deoxy-D-xylulose-5-phosphate reductoisomerase